MFNRPPLSYVPMAPALAGVVAGVLMFPLMTDVAVVALCVAAAISGVVLIVSRRRWVGRMSVFFAMGLMAALLHRQVSVPVLALDNDNYLLSGVAMEHTDTRSGAQLLVKTSEGFRAMLYISGASVAEAGDSICAKIRLSRPDSCRWPHQFDYSRYLSRRGVEVIGRVSSDSVRVYGGGSGVMWRLTQVRRSLADCLCRSDLDDGATRFLIAALLGDSSSLLPDDRSRFTSAGIAHLLALSGTHVAVVSLLVGFILFPLYLFGMRRVMLVLTVAILWIYAMLTGMSPSVCRAVIMVTVVAGAYVLRRRHSAFNSLIVAAVIILLFDPAALWSTGFQLSFMAVAAILPVHGILLSRMSGRIAARRWWIPLVSAVAVTLAATLATAPVTMRNFGIFPVYFLLANIPAMILIMPLLAGGAIVVVMELAGFKPTIVCAGVNYIYAALDDIVGFVGDLPGHLITGIVMSDITFVACMALSVMIMACLWRPRNRLIRFMTVAALVVLAGSVVVTSMTDRHDPEEEMFMVKDGRYAGLLYRDGSNAWLITPEPPVLAEMLRAKAMRAHRCYLEYYGVDSIVMSDSQLRHGRLARDGNRIVFCGEQMLFADADTVTIDDDVRTVIVCRGCTGRLHKELNAAHADSVVISPSAHWRVGRTLGDSVRSSAVVSHRQTILYRAVSDEVGIVR